MDRLRPCAIRSILLLAFLQTLELRAQPTQQPTLGEFLQKLKTIAPIIEKLTYDTFPDFDFEKLKPLSVSRVVKQISFAVGSNAKGTIRRVDIIKKGILPSTISIYPFQSLTILTLQKGEIILTELPDFPIFCIAKDSPFMVYLNKGFHYQKEYGPADIASIQILREDLFPVYVLTIRDSYIKMFTEVEYKKGQPTTLDHVSVVIDFQPEKDRTNLISGQSRFSTDYLVPRGEFFANLEPDGYVSDGLPYWMFANTFFFK